MTFFIEFDEVDEFSATAIGEPGSRVFFLNARSGGQRVSVRCEKQQVKAISMYLRQVLSDLPPPENRPMTSSEVAEPAEQAFVLGPIGLGYDRSNDRLLVQLEEMIEADLLATPADDAEEAVEAGELTASPEPPSAATSASMSRAARPTRSAITPTWSWPPAARRASGAATRSTPRDTRVLE